jgi:hypothetical protein
VGGIHLQRSLQYLNDLVNDIDTQQRIFNIYDGDSKRYTPKLKKCVYELLKLNVSASKVGDVIKEVLKIVGIEPNRIPSKSTVLEMNLQRLCLSQQQLAEVFSKKDIIYLMTDETTKFGSKFMGYECSASDGNLWVLGLKEIETKSAKDTLAVFQQILTDLDNSSNDDSVSKDIITHITATMSDRAATEVKFNELIEQYRTECLPLAYHNYDTFTEEEKSAIQNMSNFLCGLHALINYAETAEKCIRDVENQIFDNKSPSFEKVFRIDEPGKCRLIRRATKCFGVGGGGDEKSGCHGDFNTYSGSRFNILFSNACSVFFLHEQMTLYLKSVGAK